MTLVPGSVFSAAVSAAFIGFAGSIALILKAAQTLGATADQTTSWITALCIGIALTSLYLSWRFRMPVITAWSTPGAAFIASSAENINIEQAVGAFLLAAALVVLTMAIKPLSDLMKRIPSTVAAAMLAGILIQFCLDLIGAGQTAPLFVTTLVVLFFVTQAFKASLAVPVILLAGIVISIVTNQLSQSCCTASLSQLNYVQAKFEMTALIGLGLPLFLVTMASQNLTGIAVLKADNFSPSPAGAVIPTGIVSLFLAPFAAHGVCLAAIIAAICSGPGCHSDPNERWKVGPVYALCYLIFAAFTQSFVEFLLALPAVLITTFAGLALFGPLKGSLKSALAGNEQQTEAAVVTFIVTVSGLTLFGVGSALWGLIAGIIVLGIRNIAKN